MSKRVKQRRDISKRVSVHKLFSKSAKRKVHNLDVASLESPKRKAHIQDVTSLETPSESSGDSICSEVIRHEGFPSHSSNVTDINGGDALNPSAELSVSYLQELLFNSPEELPLKIDDEEPLNSLPLMLDTGLVCRGTSDLWKQDPEYSETVRFFDQLTLKDDNADITVTDNDVLLGRGGMTNKHPGNEKFRKLVKEAIPMYMDCTTKADKKNISELVVQDIKDRGGRFLKDASGNTKSPHIWIVVNQEEARKKASQALRERR